ncbi:MAG: ABC transporter substrate-binding protein [Yoonia sp.]|uniref:ABC transporter substrate-binding protein n=1 Tax=Yoonia sp. TaxID=2212373 RepID=UPI003EF65454
MKKHMLGTVAAIMLASPLAAQDTTLEVWTWFPSEDVMTKIIDAFEAENPGIDVNLNLFESSAYQDRMPLALASGDAMDVVAVQTSTMVELVRADLMPLPALFDAYGSAPLADLLTETALAQAAALASDDEVYIAPMGILGSAVVYYNGDMLDEMGIEMPTNRAEMMAFVEAVAAYNPDLLPYSFTGANWFLDEITLTIAEQGTPGFFNSVRYNQGGSWDSPEYAMAFDAITSAYADGIFAADTLDLDYGRAAELFQQGQAVAYIQGTWENGMMSAPFRAANSIPLENVVGSPLPVMVEGGAPAIRSYIDVALAVPAQAQNPELSVQFIEFMTAGGGVASWADTLFVVPSAKDFTLPDGIFNSDAAQASYDSIADLLVNPTSDRNNVSDFSAAVGDAIITAILTDASTQDQITQLQSEWESGRYSNAN